jgi:hypothetical protein
MRFELLNYNQPVDKFFFGNAETLEVFKAQLDLSSIETSKTYALDPSQPADYKVVDFTNERVYWEISLGNVKSIYRYVDGEVTGAPKTNGKEG